MSDTEIQEVSTPDNLPPLPNQHSNSSPSDAPPADAGKPKRSKAIVFVMVFFIFLLVVFGAAAAYLTQSGLLDKRSDKDALAAPQLSSPLDIVDKQTVVSQVRTNEAEIQQKTAQPASLMAGIPTVQFAQPSSVPQTESLDDVAAVPGPSPLEEDVANKQPEYLPLNQPSSLSVKQMEDLQNSVNALVMKVSQIEGKLSGVETMLFQQKGRTDSQGQSLAEIVKKIELLQKRITKVSYQIQKENLVAAKTKVVSKPQPPTPLSFAIWEGRDSVFVEYPKGKLKMLYEGEMVGDWRVEKIKATKPETVRYKSGTDIVELGLGE
jgi:hypothetical protein